MRNARDIRETAEWQRAWVTAEFCHQRAVDSAWSVEDAMKAAVSAGIARYLDELQVPIPGAETAPGRASGEKVATGAPDRQGGSEGVPHECPLPACDGSHEALYRTHWACPGCGVRYVLVKRMIGRRMRGEWRRMLGQPTEVDSLRDELRETAGVVRALRRERDTAEARIARLLARCDEIYRADYRGDAIAGPGRIDVTEVRRILTEETPDA